MELQLVTYEQAKRLKELGCYIDTRDYYDEGEQLEYDAWYHLSDHFEKHYKNNTNVSAPTVTLALKWLRDEKQTVIGISPRFSNDKSVREYCWIVSTKVTQLTGECESYEEAESAALDAALKLLESKG